jgi:AcrR family transcriptional regulator
MPKVSEQHRSNRRDQIVTAAWQCVAREGFHKTTMADVIRESGLSAGAVYGYFRSKDDIIAAIADRAVGTVDEVFDDLLSREPLPSIPAAVHALTSRAVALAEADGGDISRVALPVWAEALRNEAIHATVSSKYQQIRGRFRDLVEHLQRDGRVDPETDPAAIAQVLFGLLPGFMLQRLILGDVSPDSYAAGLAAVVPDDLLTAEVSLR